MIYNSSTVDSQTTDGKNPASEVQPCSRSNAIGRLALGSLPGSLILKSPQPVMALPKHYLANCIIWTPSDVSGRNHTETQSGWRDAPVFKSISCSCRGWGFSPQHSPGGSQPPLSPVLGPLLASTDTRHMCGTHTHTQANTHTHKVKTSF